MTRIVIVPRDATETALWRTTAEVAGLFGDLPWVVVGGQMVMLLEFELGVTSGRATRDLDVIVDVRVVVGAIRTAADRLRTGGFEPLPEHAHRFVRGQDVVDLLAPDHLGDRADLTTVPPQSTTAIPGGTRALATRRVAEVAVAGQDHFDLPIPTLAGAIALKVAAFSIRRADRDLEDLVRLLALVGDVEVLRDELKPADRRALGSIGALRDRGHRAWRVARDPDDAQAALARLADPPAGGPKHQL
jgi:hypothetical protein